MRVPNADGIDAPSISPDGSRIAYWHGDAIEVIGAAAGEPERVSTGAGFRLPEGWSRDNERLLYVDDPSGEARLFVLNLKTGGRSLLAARPGHGFYQGRFSPDGRWVSFLESVGTHATVWVAPMPESRAPAPETWIAVTQGDSLNDKPRWSPDGRLIYYLSDRDGFKCIWAQRVHPKTRRPVGAAFAVYHMHAAHLSMMNVVVGNVGFDVARDALVFNMGERAGNIWTTRLDSNRNALQPR